MFCDKESVTFPTHYFLIIQKLLANGVTALYSHKARFFTIRVRVKAELYYKPGGITPIHYLYGYVPPNGVVILKRGYKKLAHF